jgi:hypothetical protein
VIASSSLRRMGKGAFRAVPTICQLSSRLKWWARLRFAHPLERQPQGRRGSRSKISKTTPCKVTGGSLAWMLYPRKHFDTSGKSAAPFHHRAICKTAHGAAHRALGVITGQKPRQLKLHRLATARGADWSRRRNPPFQATNPAQEQSRWRRPEIGARRTHRSFGCRRPNRPETFSRARGDETTNVEAADYAFGSNPPYGLTIE